MEEVEFASNLFSFNESLFDGSSSKNESNDELISEISFMPIHTDLNQGELFCQIPSPLSVVQELKYL